jgi:hypothetical protein
MDKNTHNGINQDDALIFQISTSHVWNIQRS